MEKKLIKEWLNEGSVSIPNLLLQYYKHIDLNETECFMLIQIYSFLSKGIHFPTPEQLSERMTLTSEECMQTIQKLIVKKVLLIEEHQNPYSESYSLAPLWDKLARFIINHEQKKINQKIEDNVFALFEKEFARPLSPIEYETITMWLDQDNHSPELIKAALKEAVLSGKLNFRYIDRILFEWKKNGIKTVEEAHHYGEKFRRHQQKPYENKEKKPNVNYPFYNWL